jgi:hypothetical protein
VTDFFTALALSLLTCTSRLLDPVTCPSSRDFVRSPIHHLGDRLLPHSLQPSRFLPSSRATGGPPTSRSTTSRLHPARETTIRLISSTTTIRTARGPPSTPHPLTPTSHFGVIQAILSTSSLTEKTPCASDSESHQTAAIPQSLAGSKSGPASHRRTITRRGPGSSERKTSRYLIQGREQSPKQSR